MPPNISYRINLPTIVSYVTLGSNEWNVGLNLVKKFKNYVKPCEGHFNLSTQSVVKNLLMNIEQFLH
jgi:uncharacterized membrane protein